MAVIVANDIPGMAVWGVSQSDYTVDGVPNRDFGSALAVAALRQSGAIESECEAYMAMVRTRIRKIEELGEALSVISEALATMRVKKAESDDLSDADPRLFTAKSILQKYGLELNVMLDGRITREEASMRQNDVQYAIDNEDNSLQQDMVSLQGLVSKRDNSFSTAAKLVGKVNDTAQTLIGNIGG